MRSDGRNSVKSLVLASVFIECYLRERKLTVSELLGAHRILNDHYGRRPHVLSNVLRRYRKQGLLYREYYFVRGHPYRYNLTEKGFRRLFWMFKHSGSYLFCGADLLVPLASAFAYVWGKRKIENDLRNLRSLQVRLAAHGLHNDSAEVEAIIQSTESSLKASYNETKLSEVLIEFRETTEYFANSLARARAVCYTSIKYFS